MTRVGHLSAVVGGEGVAVGQGHCGTGTLISVQQRTLSLWVPSALQRLADTNLDCFSLKGCLPLFLTVSPRAVDEESEASGRGAELSRKGAVRLNCCQACAHSQGI